MGALLFVLGLSVTLCFFPERPLVRRVVFFPRSGAVSGYLGGEIKSVPARTTKLGELRELALAIIQGPLSFSFLPVCMRETGLRGVYIVNDIAFLDMDIQFLAPFSRSDVEPVVRIEALDQTIRYNMPGIRQVRVMIEGHETGTWPRSAK